MDDFVRIVEALHVTREQAPYRQPSERTEAQRAYEAQRRDHQSEEAR